MSLSSVAYVMLGYLFGSVPFSYIAGRAWRGLDLRIVGSRNVGALNVFGQVGPLPAALALLGDVGKGFLPVLIAMESGAASPVWYATGLAAFAGHNWPIWLRFQGGKGAATALGTFLALAPTSTVIIVAIALIVIFFSRNVAFGLGVGFAVLPVLAYGVQRSLPLISYLVLLALLVFLRQLPSIWQIWRDAPSKREAILFQLTMDRSRRRGRDDLG